MRILDEEFSKDSLIFYSWFQSECQWTKFSRWSHDGIRKSYSTNLSSPISTFRTNEIVTLEFTYYFLAGNSKYLLQKYSRLLFDWINSSKSLWNHHGAIIVNISIESSRLFAAETVILNKNVDDLVFFLLLSVSNACISFDCDVLCFAAVAAAFFLIYRCVACVWFGTILFWNIIRDWFAFIPPTNTEKFDYLFSWISKVFLVRITK